MNIKDLSTNQTLKIIAIKRKIEKLQDKIDSIASVSGILSQTNDNITNLGT